MIRVLAVSDPSEGRSVVTTILSADPEVDLVGHVDDGHRVLPTVRQLRPDVVTVDDAGPAIDRIATIRSIMAEVPTPIVVVVRSGAAEGERVFRAMEAGALTVLEKPDPSEGPRYITQAQQLIATVKLIAGVQVRARPVPDRSVRRPVGNDLTTTRRVSGRASYEHRAAIVALAASTGGPAALAQVLRGLPDGLEVPVLLVQHIEPGFEEGLIQWLSSVTQLSVRLASDGARLCPGELLVAPTGSHLGVSEGATAVLSKAAPIGSFRPSATFLFRTVARVYGRRSVAVVLTGMGRDGADGVMEVGRAGGFVIAQDEATSVVHGMPTAAIDTGMVSRILPVEAISGAILARCRVV